MSYLSLHIKCIAECGRLILRKFWWRNKGNHYVHLDSIKFWLYSFEKIASPWRREVNVCMYWIWIKNKLCYGTVFLACKEQVLSIRFSFYHSIYLGLTSPYSLIFHLQSLSLEIQLPFQDSLLKVHWLLPSNTIIWRKNVGKGTIWLF